MAFIWVVILSLLLAVDASLVANYPVNAQLPPVARVSQPFRFTYSQGTFGGVDANTKYSLKSAPPWLQLDSASRTLSGTPRSQDTGPNKFELVASNGPESVGMQVTFIVTSEDGPEPGKPLLPQLEAIGATSAPSTIFVHSGDSFVMSFSPDTFSNTRASTFYYGTSPENAPLPSWIRFDQSNLEFSGTTPNTGPQTFKFNLVASDIAGFSAATMSFEMTVSPHILSFNQSAQTLFLPKGQRFSSPHFRDILTLDGRQPGSAEVASIEADSPKWSTFEKDTISLSGTPPADAVNENVTISVTDTYGDVARMIVTLQYSHFFTGRMTECNAVVGDDFTLVFNNSILIDDSVQLEVDLGRQLPWLRYNPDNKTLYGRVPLDTRIGSFPITLTARKEAAKDSEQFTINVRADHLGERTANSADSDQSGGGIHGKKAGIIAISVIIPFVFVTSLFLLFCCWRHKRRAGASAHEEGGAPNEKDPGLPPPNLPQCQPYEHTTAGDVPIIFRSPSPSSKPPKLELRSLWSGNSSGNDKQPYALDSEDKENALPHSTIEWDFAPLTRDGPQEEKRVNDAVAQSKRLSLQSSPSLSRRATANSRKREPLKSIQPRRSLKRNSVASSRSRRYSRRSSGISSVASGLPVRLSGAGHGAGGFGPPGHGMVRISWQNTHVSFQSDESSVGNLAPLFLRPPPRGRNSVEFRGLDYPKQVSVRAVEPDSPNLSESDSLEAFVHYRAKSRNSSNPLFSGQFNRRTSSGLRALERARSTASRADTVSSSVYNDGYRQSYIRERPGSTAMSAISASVYTDDNRNSAFMSNLGQDSLSSRYRAPLAKKQSQSSLAQNYSKIIAPLPRCFSETSLSSARRHGAGDLTGGSDDSPDVYEDHQGNQRLWYRGNPYLQGESGTRRCSLRKSPSTLSVPVEGTARRVSLVRFAEMDNDGDGDVVMKEADDQRWRPRQPLSTEHRGNCLPREVTGSVKSDIAFV
ncbi:putative transmembrane glycoprotein [Aspergillus clavatus NRRL 1]|uniref:Transmembrane glycoprotein, putative n=1 Tax=Aspergillus clavatus (strain ATCC 1007 / CBS 513.65 / DSM 816 / NCTC 3887 / NRRL 1 / QM 1276 / 107) TaxID=344612 RepID=A1CQI2_ASPCL|nr:transmembrane glycoprotein, putative [Aspergillus clavatus NRRL 1]EAW07903.1 transmembrane glycoprotein, putative [Aspergillus clavatus NRRL 1]